MGSIPLRIDLESVNFFSGKHAVSEITLAGAISSKKHLFSIGGGVTVFCFISKVDNSL